MYGTAIDRARMHARTEPHNATASDRTGTTIALTGLKLKLYNLRRNITYAPVRKHWLTRSPHIYPVILYDGIRKMINAIRMSVDIMPHTNVYPVFPRPLSIPVRVVFI